MPKTLISEIEARTEADVHRALQAAGIKKGTGSYRDYTRAKRLLFENSLIEPDTYNEQVKYIADYLRI